MNRLECNLKIADILIDSIWRFYGLQLKELAEMCPQQRAGQIICNYICTNYRSDEFSFKARIFLNSIFPNNPDPFFEESEVTLKRLQKSHMEYVNLDEILELNIPDTIKDEFKTKLGKKVFFDSDGKCKVGKLIGINEKSQYVIDVEDNKIYVPCYNSLTLL